MGDMERFDSTALFSIFKNEEGDNLLPFDEMAALLDLGELEVPLVPNPLANTEAPVLTPQSNILESLTAPVNFTSTIPVDVPTTNPTPPPQPATAAAITAKPSTSGGGESDHTRTPGWGGSNPSSVGGDSEDSDMEDLHQENTGAPSSTTTGVPGGGGRASRAGKASSGIKKRRQRSAEQMESNRVAQQKYRQRKKQEQSTLQQAVDMLTAQVAAFKAVEVRNVELEASNAALRATVSQQGSDIRGLQQHSAAQAAELEATRNALVASQEQLAAQGKVILDQQAKLKLQEEIIAALKDRLKERIDEAMLHVVPGTVCEKMVAAVKATLYGAKDVNGLQETLSQLPEHLVTELCKNIFHVCKETWPELRMRCNRQFGGGACMTGAA